MANKVRNEALCTFKRILIKNTNRTHCNGYMWRKLQYWDFLFHFRRHLKNSGPTWARYSTQSLCVLPTHPRKLRIWNQTYRTQIRQCQNYHSFIVCKLLLRQINFAFVSPFSESSTSYFRKFQELGCRICVRSSSRSPKLSL